MSSFYSGTRCRSSALPAVSLGHEAFACSFDASSSAGSSDAYHCAPLKDPAIGESGPQSWYPRPSQRAAMTPASVGGHWGVSVALACSLTNGGGGITQLPPQSASISHADSKGIAIEAPLKPLATRPVAATPTRLKPNSAPSSGQFVAPSRGYIVAASIFTQAAADIEGSESVGVLHLIEMFAELCDQGLRPDFPGFLPQTFAAMSQSVNAVGKALREALAIWGSLGVGCMATARKGGEFTRYVADLLLLGSTCDDSAGHFIDRGPPQSGTLTSAALRIVGVLARRSLLDPAIAAGLRAGLVARVLQALRAPAPLDAINVAWLGSISTLGIFTDEVLLELKHAPGPDSWRAVAREELKRQLLWRQWSCWEAKERTAGTLAWVAYNIGLLPSVSGAEGSSSDSFRLTSAGEVCGLVGAQLRVSTTLDEDASRYFALQSSSSDSWHVEDAFGRALLMLAIQIARAFPATALEGRQAEGTVLLFSPRPPSIASLYALQQFCRLFPSIRVYAACDGGSPAACGVCYREGDDPCQCGGERSRGTIRVIGDKKRE